jgi:hypothetical protein
LMRWFVLDRILLAKVDSVGPEIQGTCWRPFVWSHFSYTSLKAKVWSRNSMVISAQVRAIRRQEPMSCSQFVWRPRNLRYVQSAMISGKPRMTLDQSL